MDRTHWSQLFLLYFCVFFPELGDSIPFLFPQPPAFLPIAPVPTFPPVPRPVVNSNKYRRPLERNSMKCVNYVYDAEGSRKELANLWNQKWDLSVIRLNLEEILGIPKTNTFSEFAKAINESDFLTKVPEIKTVFQECIHQYTKDFINVITRRNRTFFECANPEKGNVKVRGEIFCQGSTTTTVTAIPTTKPTTTTNPTITTYHSSMYTPTPSSTTKPTSTWRTELKIKPTTPTWPPPLW